MQKSGISEKKREVGDIGIGLGDGLIQYFSVLGKIIELFYILWHGN
jgi:hypothetical protein